MAQKLFVSEAGERGAGRDDAGVVVVEGADGGLAQGAGVAAVLEARCRESDLVFAVAEAVEGFAAVGASGGDGGGGDG